MSEDPDSTNYGADVTAPTQVTPAGTIVKVDKPKPSTVINTPTPTVPTGYDYAEQFKTNPVNYQPPYQAQAPVIIPQQTPQQYEADLAKTEANRIVYQNEAESRIMTSQTAELNIQLNQQLVDWQLADIDKAKQEYAVVSAQKGLYTPESYADYESSYFDYLTAATTNIAAIKSNTKALEIYAPKAKLYETQFDVFVADKPSERQKELLSQSLMYEPAEPTQLENVIGAVKANPVGGAVIGGLETYESIIGAPSVALRGETEALFNYADVAKQSSDPLERALGLGAAIGGYGASVGAGIYDFTTFLARPVLMAGTAYGLAMVGVGGVKAIQGDTSMLRGIGESMVGRGGANLIGMIGGMALTPSVFNLVGKGIQRVRPRYQVNEILEMKGTEVGTIQENIGDITMEPFKTEGMMPSGETMDLTSGAIRGEQKPLMNVKYTGVSKPIPRAAAELYPSELGFDTIIGVEKEGGPIAIRGVSGEDIAPPKGAKMGEPWVFEKVEPNLEVSSQVAENPPQLTVKGKLNTVTGEVEPYTFDKSAIYKEIGGEGGGGVGGSWERIQEPALHPEAPTGEFEFSRTLTSGKLVESKVGTFLEGWLEKPSAGETPTPDMFMPYDLTRPTEPLPMGEPILEGGIEGIKPTEFTVDIKAATKTVKPEIEFDTRLQAPRGDFGEVKANLDKFPGTLSNQPVEPTDTIMGKTPLNKTFGYTPAKSPSMEAASGQSVINDLVQGSALKSQESLKWVTRSAPVDMMGSESALIGVSAVKAPTQQRAASSLFAPQSSALMPLMEPKVTLPKLRQPSPFSLGYTGLTPVKMVTQTTPTREMMNAPPTFKPITITPTDLMQTLKQPVLQTPTQIIAQFSRDPTMTLQPTKMKQVRTPGQNDILLPQPTPQIPVPKVAPPKAMPPMVGDLYSFKGSIWGSRIGIGKEKRRYRIGNPLKGFFRKGRSGL